MPSIRMFSTTVFLFVALLFLSNTSYAQPCNVSSGSVNFKSGSELTRENMSQLHALAEEMRANPNCRVVVLGNGSITKFAQQASWVHATNIISYLNDKENIARDRLIIMIRGEGDINIADYRAAYDDETGSSTMSPPFPEIRP